MQTGNKPSRELRDEINDLLPSGHYIIFSKIPPESNDPRNRAIVKVDGSDEDEHRGKEKTGEETTGEETAAEEPAFARLPNHVLDPKM